MKRDLYGGAIQAIVPATFLDARYFDTLYRFQPHTYDSSLATFGQFQIIKKCSWNKKQTAVLSLRSLKWLRQRAMKQQRSFIGKNLQSAIKQLGPLFLHQVGFLKCFSELSHPFCSGIIPCSANAPWSAAWVEGLQNISKFRSEQGAENTVRVFLACIRIPQHRTDILISFNDPVRIHPSSSSARAIDGVAFQTKEDGAALFERVLGSFNIVDFSLFG
jgi:hypothetical protein